MTLTQSFTFTELRVASMEHYQRTRHGNREPCNQPQCSSSEATISKLPTTSQSAYHQLQMIGTDASATKSWTSHSDGQYRQRVQCVTSYMYYNSLLDHQFTKIDANEIHILVLEHYFSDRGIWASFYVSSPPLHKKVVCMQSFIFTTIHVQMVSPA